MSEFLEAARAYHALGYHPIPCDPRDKRPLLIDGKRLHWEPYQVLQPLPDEIETWWGENPNANVALVLGRGTFAVDLDGGNDAENGDEAEKLLNSRFIVLPDGAPRSKTGHGGHVFLSGSVGDRVGLMTTGGVKPQVDIKGVGYVVVPPSIHPHGQRYIWEIPLVSPNQLPPAPLGLLALIGTGNDSDEEEISVGVGGSGWVSEYMAGVPEGRRDYACTRLAGYFLGKDLPEGTVETILMRTFAPGCTPPADLAMVRKCVRSVGQRERRGTAVLEPERPIAAQSLAQALDAWQESRLEPAAIVRTPFYKLNTYLGGGYSAGDLIYIGARPGVGKSALALAMARSAASDEQAVLIISREMTNIALARRMVTQESGIATVLLKRADPLPLEDAASLTDALIKLRPLPIWLSDEVVSIDEIAALTTAMQARVPMGLLIVDYLQLVRAPKEIRDRRLQVEAVSSGLKLLAMEQKLPVVCLSSLARMEKGTSRRPTLSDLRETGELEHDADVVILLHRDMMEPDMECILAKNREGSPGIIKLNFDGASLRFSETE